MLWHRHVSVDKSDSLETNAVIWTTGDLPQMHEKSLSFPLNHTEGHLVSCALCLGNTLFKALPIPGDKCKRHGRKRDRSFFSPLKRTFFISHKKGRGEHWHKKTPYL